jgi:PilZ domain
MGDARKFLNRAPRYTLQPSDNRYLRFAHKNELGHTHTTRFIDISATGLAFVIDKDVAPQIFEMIKVEIPLDDGQSVAWWGKVVRIEEYAAHRWYMKGSDVAHENQVMVAVNFQELPQGHTAAIRHSLDKKFDELYARQRRERMKNVSLFLASQIWRIALYAMCVLFMVWFFYYFSQPDANYDPKIGSPWGQRFPALNIFGSGSDRQ